MIARLLGGPVQENMEKSPGKLTHYLAEPGGVPPHLGHVSSKVKLINGKAGDCTAKILDCTLKTDVCRAGMWKGNAGMRDNDAGIFFPLAFLYSKMISFNYHLFGVCPYEK